MTYNDIETFVRGLFGRNYLLLVVVILTAIAIPVAISYLEDEPEPSYYYLNSETP